MSPGSLSLPSFPDLGNVEQTYPKSTGVSLLHRQANFRIHTKTKAWALEDEISSFDSSKPLEQVTSLNSRFLNHETRVAIPVKLARLPSKCQDKGVTNKTKDEVPSRSQVAVCP